MKRYLSPLLMLVLAIFMMAPGWAQAGSGFYISSDIGLNVASGIDTTGFSNDRSSVCDEYINPMFRDVYGTPGYTSESVNCISPNRGATGNWQNQFDSATGILAGAAIGYSFAKQNPGGPLGGLRVELEYFYRQSNYDETSTVGGYDCVPPILNESIQKVCDEISQATDRIDSMSSHNIFGNVYYDFANTSRFTPYIGIGGGVGVTNMEYGSVWARHNDPANIDTGAGLPNADEIRQNLAGTVSVAQATLSDTLYGLQILFGVDYAVTEAMSLGLKGRWVRFGSFENGNDAVWDPLRSHVPNIRRDGSEPVAGGIRTDNIQFFGISLNMKYHF